MPVDQAKFGERLRSAIALAKTTPTRIANDLGWSPSTVGNLVRGDRTPACDTLVDLAVRDVSTDHLLGIDDAIAERGGCPPWLRDLLPALARLDLPARKAVRVLIRGLDPEAKS